MRASEPGRVCRPGNSDQMAYPNYNCCIMWFIFLGTCYFFGKNYVFFIKLNEVNFMWLIRLPEFNLKVFLSSKVHSLLKKNSLSIRAKDACCPTRTAHVGVSQ